MAPVMGTRVDVEHGWDLQPYTNAVRAIMGASATPSWRAMAARVLALQRRHAANFPAMSGVFALPTRKRVSSNYVYAHISGAARLVTAKVHCRSTKRLSMEVTVFGPPAPSILTAVRAAVAARVLRRGHYLVHYALPAAADGDGDRVAGGDGDDGGTGDKPVLLGWTWVTPGREPSFCPCLDGSWDEDKMAAVPAAGWCDGRLDDDFLEWLPPSEHDRTLVVLCHNLSPRRAVWTLTEMDEDGALALVDWDVPDTPKVVCK